MRPNCRFQDHTLLGLGGFDTYIQLHSTTYWLTFNFFRLVFSVGIITKCGKLFLIWEERGAAVLPARDGHHYWLRTGAHALPRDRCLNLLCDCRHWKYRLKTTSMHFTFVITAQMKYVCNFESYVTLEFH